MLQLIIRQHHGWKAFLRDEKAATAIEYAMVAAATGFVLAAAMIALRNVPLWGIFDIISDALAGFTNP
jgi:Flp pilus assembly pilin Flp